MDIQKFIEARPNLYHLTDEKNVKHILSSRSLNSTATLVHAANLADAKRFLRTRRLGHFPLTIGKNQIVLRDQDPLFKRIVDKNLDGGWTFEDFVYSLNERVFLWPTEKDLRIHYGRYENQGEFPKILRIRTEDLFKINKHEPQFCRLNSGAPRCSYYYTEGAPPRGPKTFLPAAAYDGTPSSIREVTFLNFCVLPEDIWESDHPDKTFIKVK